MVRWLRTRPDPMAPLTPRARIVAALAIAVAAAGVAVTSAAFRSDMEAAQQRLQGRSTVVQSPYGPIEYALTGQGAPVLGIHGTGGGFDQGLEMIGPLAAYGFQVIAPSRFGYLRSGWPTDVSPEAQADAFAWLIERLGHERVAVVGGSAGALSAMQFAIRHPDKCQALILLVPAAFAPDREPNTSGAQNRLAEAAMQAWLRSDFLFWLSLKAAPDQMTRLLLATEPAVLAATGPGEAERVADVLRHILPVSARSRGLASDAIAGAPPPYPLERISCPVLAISAEDDLFGTHHAAVHAARTAPAGRLLSFPSGGHILAGRGEAVWQATAAFLAEAWREVP
jgi:2-hydroxy-6-oxonona-2,4-dienedioate hydrolase